METLYHDHARLSAESALGRWEIDRVDAPVPGGEPPLLDVCWRGVDLLTAWMELERLLPTPDTAQTLEVVRATCKADKEALLACFVALAPEHFPGPWLPACEAWDDLVQGLTPECDEVEGTIAAFEKFDEVELAFAAVAALTGYAIPNDEQHEALIEMTLWLEEFSEVLIPIREHLARNVAHMRGEDLASENPLLALSVAKFERGRAYRDEILAYEATKLPRIAP